MSSLTQDKHKSEWCCSLGYHGILNYYSNKQQIATNALLMDENIEAILLDGGDWSSIEKEINQTSTLIPSTTSTTESQIEVTHHQLTQITTITQQAINYIQSNQFTQSVMVHYLPLMRLTDIHDFIITNYSP